MNAETLALVKRWEVFKAEPYVDNGGALAIGYGHSTNLPKVELGMVITEAEAHEILLADLERFGKILKRWVTVPLNEYQYGACCSLMFNIGPGNFKKSEVLAHINNTTETYHFEKAAVAFLSLCRAKDKVTGIKREFLGLKIRRITEASLFLTKVD